jgi:hypothetical protein
MACAQVADGGDGCEYIEKAVADSRQWVILQLRRLGVGLITPRRKSNFVTKYHKGAQILTDIASVTIVKLYSIA